MGPTPTNGSGQSPGAGDNNPVPMQTAPDSSLHPDTTPADVRGDTLFIYSGLYRLRRHICTETDGGDPLSSSRHPAAAAAAAGSTSIMIVIGRQRAETALPSSAAALPSAALPPVRPPASHARRQRVMQQVTAQETNRLKFQ